MPPPRPASASRDPVVLPTGAAALAAAAAGTPILVRPREAGKQVRERYINHLDAAINHGPFSSVEDRLVYRCVCVWRGGGVGDSGGSGQLEDSLEPGGDAVVFARLGASVSRLLTRCLRTFCLPPRRYHHTMGTKWAEIAKFLPGRCVRVVGDRRRRRDVCVCTVEGGGWGSLRRAAPRPGGCRVVVVLARS